MIVEILTAHMNWKPGDAVDVTRSYGAELIAGGIARLHEDQSRRDYTPKEAKAEEPQKIEVHNYFLTEEPAQPKQRRDKHKNANDGNGS